MNRQLFYQYLDNPYLLNEDSLKHLNELMAEYPYFQVGRMLLVKNMAILGHIKYNVELKNAAAHIPDRRQLYFLVQSPLAAPTLPIVTPSNTPQISFSETIAKPEVNTETSSLSESRTIESTQPSQEQRPIEETLPEIKPTEPTPSKDNYFEVSDIINLKEGLTIDFSKTFNSQPEPDVDVLPAADLLDYELGTSPAYDINDELKPSFDPSQPQSFSMWLKVLRHPPKTEEPNQPQPALIDKQMQIIESFLQKGRDRIAPDKNELGIHHEDISASSVQESDALMTETLANIHIKQKQYEKAIVIFEKLGLKYPEKSIYFAARIKETERLISNL
ncbi:MAG: hypothetical protein QM786_01910 [Breznakibacter sp.]